MVLTRLHEGVPDGGGAMGIADQRAAIVREEKERLAERNTRIEAQRSPLTPPHERIRLWEQLHALQLPRRADHKLVKVVATQTALSVGEVRDEQTRRATLLMQVKPEVLA